MTQMGAPASQSNIAFLNAWGRKEGGHTQNRASYNWLNTTLGSNYPSINSVGVRAFPDYQTGLNMTQRTLGGYPALVNHLMRGVGLDALRSQRGQADLNRWLTGKRTPGESAYVRSISQLAGEPIVAQPRTNLSAAVAPRLLSNRGLAGDPLMSAAREMDPRSRAMALTRGMFSSLAAPMAAGGRPTTPSLPGVAPGGVSGGAGGIAELFYDPRGGYDEGSWIGPIGGHENHVHVSFKTPSAALAAIQMARRFGLSARENPYTDQVDPVHTRTSYHYRNFPGKYDGRSLGMGLDVSGNPEAMKKFYDWVATLVSGA